MPAGAAHVVRTHSLEFRTTLSWKFSKKHKMIKVIDKIKYLPKDKSSFIDANEIINIGFKQFVENIEKKSRTINTNGKYVTVSLICDVKRHSNSTIQMQIECEDADISEMVRKELSLQ